MGEPVDSGGKEVCRTLKTRSPSMAGFQEIMEEGAPLQRGSLASGPISLDWQLRAALPPELDQCWAQAVAA